MQRILYIHQDGKFTGSALSLSNLIRQLDRIKYEAWVLMAEEGPARQLFESAGAKVEVILFPRFWTFPGPRWYSRNAWRQLYFISPVNLLKKRVKALNPDLIHINDKAAAPAGWALRHFNSPIVQHLRSSYYPTASGLHRWVSCRMIRRFATAFIAISEDEIDGFEDLPHEIIFNTVDLEKAERAREKRAAIRREYGIKNETFLAGYLSVVSPIRGIWNFLEMAKAVLNHNNTNQKTRPEFKFLVVGALPETEDLKIQLEASIYNYDLKNQVYFTGFQEDALAYLAAFDVLVISNEHGVLGRPAFEALATGTPTIAFAGHSGKSKVLQDGVTSKIVARGDVAALANALLCLAENPADYHKMRSAALDSAHKNFSPEKNARKVMALYERLLQKIPND